MGKEESDYKQSYFSIVIGAMMEIPKAMACLRAVDMRAVELI